MDRGRTTGDHRGPFAADSGVGGVLEPQIDPGVVQQVIDRVGDNPTVGGVAVLVVVMVIVGWAMNTASPPARTPPSPGVDEKEKAAVEAALKAYKDAKR